MADYAFGSIRPIDFALAVNPTTPLLPIRAVTERVGHPQIRVNLTGVFP